MRSRFLEMGSEPARVDPDAFGEFLNAEEKRWLQVVQDSGAKVSE